MPSTTDCMTIIVVIDSPNGGFLLCICGRKIISWLDTAFGHVVVPVVPVAISVGINPDHYITEDRPVNDTASNVTIIPGL